MSKKNNNKNKVSFLKVLGLSIKFRYFLRNLFSSIYINVVEVPLGLDRKPYPKIHGLSNILNFELSYFLHVLSSKSDESDDTFFVLSFLYFLFEFFYLFELILKFFYGKLTFYEKCNYIIRFICFSLSIFVTLHLFLKYFYAPTETKECLAFLDEMSRYGMCIRLHDLKNFLKYSRLYSQEARQTIFHAFYFYDLTRYLKISTIFLPLRFRVILKYSNLINLYNSLKKKNDLYRFF